MKIVATIEARMSSTRLPGKTLMLSAGKTMLEHLVNRLKRVRSVDQIILATTINTADDVLVSEAKRLKIDCFRGSENDVMDRVLGAASSVNADILVEITADCPIIDPGIVEQCIQMFKAHSVDYVSNVIIRSYPDGMDVQVMSLDVLRRSATMTDDPLDLEHVSLHIRRNPEIFSHVHLIAPPEQYWPELGLTLDEFKDFELIDVLINFFDSSKPLFSCLDAITHIRENRELAAINKNVSRKGNT